MVHRAPNASLPSARLAAGPFVDPDLRGDVRALAGPSRARRAAMAASAWLGASLLGLLAVGCGPDGDEATLEILEPENGVMLTLASDENPDVEGVQITVRAQAIGLAVDEEVRLRVDGATASTARVPSDGMIVFTGVTIGSGPHQLVASAREGAVQSDAVTVTVDDACFAVGFVTPEPAGDSITLGPADDTDGEACGTSFETTVVISTAASDGSEARIFVNGTPRRTATVSAGAARFTNVGLDNRGTTPNELRVTVTNAAGVVCGAALPIPIFVDCEGASCQITQPDTESPFLNQNDDTSSEEGFQGDFEVTTDEAGAGNPIRLVIDGNESDAPSVLPDGTVAAFGGVDLSEGVHRIVAHCEDDAGNVTRSGAAEWTVDITPCDVAIAQPTEGQLFVDSDDIDPDLTNIQIQAVGTAGLDCSGLRVATCSGIDAVDFGGAERDWTSTVTLGSTATQSVCAEARDEAGNVSRSEVAVRVNTTSPQVEIATPEDGAAFNIAGTADRTADLVSGNTTCEAAFEVYCTGLGEDVLIVRADTMNVLGTASCVADAGVPSPYEGRATFAMVSLPSVQTGASFPVIARQTVDRLTGESASISLRSDCVAPALTVTRPMCGAELRPGTQDEDPETAEFEYRTVVQNPTHAAADVTLTIQQAGGGAVTYMATDTTDAATVNFANASYGMGGELEIIAEATDNAGNLGTSPMCTVTVEDLPTVTFTAPLMGDVLTTADDCDAAAGLQVAIQGTTDADPGSEVAVDVNGTTTMATTSGTAPGSSFDVCVDVPEGRDVTIEVTITDTRGSGSSSISVTVDTEAPTTPISDLDASTVVDRRGGIVRFTWTEVPDAGGATQALDGYILRCASDPIVTEEDWDAATDRPVTTAPSTGNMPTEDIGGFRVGVTYHCVLRGEDPAGNLTPLPDSSVEVSLEFLIQEVLPPTDAEGTPLTTGLGWQVAAVGDVNGDMIDDVLIGGTGQASLYFGSDAGLPAALGALFTSSEGGFGERVAALGDVNGDGIGDFAISAHTADANRGKAYVLFGRPSDRPWPVASSRCELTAPFRDAPTCIPDIVINSDDIAWLGYSISSAGDFNGDGLMDILLGAPIAVAASFVGRAYVILGQDSFPTAMPPMGDDPVTPGTTMTVPGVLGEQPRGFTLAPPENTGQLGASVSSIGGDVTGDGRHDLLIGAIGSTSLGAPSRTFAVHGQMYSGTGLVDLPTSALREIDTGGTNQYATNVGAAGDLDGDGDLDLQVYDLRAGARGQLWLYLRGSTGYTAEPDGRFRIANTIGHPDGVNDGFGESFGLGRHPFLGVLGDMDADGRVDTFVGSNENLTAPGSAHLFYTDPPLAERLRADADVNFPSAEGNTGRRVAGYVGDVNGDGFNDMAVGEPRASADAGRLFIIY